MTVEEGVKYWLKKQGWRQYVLSSGTDADFVYSINEWIESGRALTTFQAKRLLRIFSQHEDYNLRAIARDPKFTVPVEASKVYVREAKGLDGYAVVQIGKSDENLRSEIQKLGGVVDPESRYVFHLEINPENVTRVFDFIAHHGLKFDDEITKLIADAMQPSGAAMVAFDGAIYASVQADTSLSRWLVDVMGGKKQAHGTYRMELTDRNVRLAHRLASERRLTLADDFPAYPPHDITNGFTEREIDFIGKILDHDFLVSILGPTDEWKNAFKEAVRISGKKLFSPSLFPVGFDEERITPSELLNVEVVERWRRHIAISRTVSPHLLYHPHYTVIGDYYRAIGNVEQSNDTEKTFFNHYVVW